MAANEPYGAVTYADPGYQSDGVKRYPIDTEAHTRAAPGPQGREPRGTRAVVRAFVRRPFE